MSNVYDWRVQAVVEQYGASVMSDDQAESLHQTRDHALQINSRDALVDMWIRDGRVFEFHNPAIQTPETMSGAGTALTLTDPSIRFTVPAGVIAVPIWAAVSGTRVITKDDIFAVIVTGSDSYTSGGEACSTPLNCFVEPASASLRTSGLTNVLHSDTAIVEAALVNPRLLKRIKHEGVTGEVDAPWEPEYNILKGDPMVYMKGPASFLVFAVQETTAMEAAFTVGVAILQNDLISA